MMQELHIGGWGAAHSDLATVYYSILQYTTTVTG